MRKNIFNLRTLIVLALLAGLGAVFKAFLSFDFTPSGFKEVDISLAPVPVMLSGILFGPLAGGLVGFVAETAGFFMEAPAGGYNPVFSITMALFGVIAGLFYLKSEKNSIWKATSLSITVQIVCSVIINTLAIWLFYGAPLIPLLIKRSVGALIELPLYAWLLMVLIEALRPLVHRSFRPQTT